jgi:hypothetical protein
METRRSRETETATSHFGGEKLANAVWATKEQ